MGKSSIPLVSKAAQHLQILDSFQNFQVFFFSLKYSFLKIHFIEVQLTYPMPCQFQVYSKTNLPSMYIHIHSFSIHSPYRLSESVEYTSQRYTEGSCFSSVLCIVVCICQSPPSIFTPPPNQGNHKFGFEIFEFVSVYDILLYHIWNLIRCQFLTVG